MAARTPILFTLLLFILASTASAYDIQDENIWIYQGAYQLGIGEKAELEGFAVKLHTISDDGTSATILIYRNGVFKEAYFIDYCEYGTEQTCDDGFDNDCDGFIDCDDDDCDGDGINNGTSDFFSMRFISIFYQYTL